MIRYVRIKLLSKASLTLKDLNDNAEEVLGRKHYRDRDITINNIRFSAGVNTVTVTADSTGKDSDYKLNMIFYNVKSKDESNRQYPIKIKIGKKYKYFQKLSYTKHPVKVFCQCKWFRFAAEWYLKDVDALQPKRKRRPYKRKTNWWPSPNPDRLPVICKHLFQLALELRRQGYLIK